MYTCKKCNYESNDRTAYYHHTKTKKHNNILNNVTKSDYEEIVKELEKTKHKLELKEEEMQKKLLEKDKEKLEAINKIYQEFALKSVTNTQNNTINIGNLNYVNEHFKTAPVLEKITDFVIDGIDTNDITQIDKFIDNIIYYHKNKSLHEFLGDHIVKIYKKNNLNEQSFHTTDITRLNYVVRIIKDSIEDFELSEDEIDNFIPRNNDVDTEEEEYLELKEQYMKSKKALQKKNMEKSIILHENKDIKFNKLWITDKKGFKICKFLIEPTIRHVLRILKKKAKDKVSNKIKIKNIEKELNTQKILSEIIESIDKNKLKHEINKYIAPHFSLIKNK